MSGGTDSSVAAMKLKPVMRSNGITFRFTKWVEKRNIWKMRGAGRTVGYWAYYIRCKGTFRERIIRYFIDEYLAGHTPFPVPSAIILKWKLLGNSR